MKRMMGNRICLLARVLSLGFVAFLSLFALDVFEGGGGWIVMGSALLMHLMPAMMLLGVGVVSWKYELAGAVGYLAFGVLYVLLVGVDRHWSWYTAISGPAIIISMLFTLCWYLKKRRKGRGVSK